MPPTQSRLKNNQMDVNLTHPQQKLDPHYVVTGPPRMSVPISFLSAARFQSALALVLALAICFLGQTASTVSAQGLTSSQLYATAQNPFNSTGCVCSYDVNRDYFPVKLAQSYSEKFTISYHKSYKIVTVRDVAGLGDFTYVLVLCGTPVPDFARIGLNSTDRTYQTVEIPVRTAGVMSSTFLPFIEYLGQRPSVQFVNSGNPGSFGSCQNKLFEQGMLFGGSLGNNMAALQQASKLRTGTELDVVFTDTWSINTAHTQTSKLPDAITVLVGDSQETNPLAIVEWIEFYSAFYNLEGAAADVTNNIYNRYLCSKKLIDDARTLGLIPARKMKVFWADTNTNAALVVNTAQGSCPNWYCPIIHDAGAEMVPTLNATYTREHAMNDADIWIYPGDNFDRPGAYYVRPYLVHNGNENSTKVIQEKKVFDILGQNLQEYFETVKQQPDVFLLDIAQALYGDSFIPSRNRFILRNALLEPAAPQGARSSALCENPAAARNDNWLTGACSHGALMVRDVAYGAVRPPNDMCVLNAATPPPTNSTSEASGVSSSFALAVGAFIGVNAVLL